jgi:beta-lactamase superfamily II metal-dependent hydrolase
VSLKIKVLPAYKGDSLLILVENHKIMIDTGTKKSYSKGLVKYELTNDIPIDLLILTH